mmetsp:Transcript_155/g.327  ORF Transcript_155/g.327 Transcript_155/m.327 type:complete len:210 (+) Transcript_155:1220-1849(+)
MTHSKIPAARIDHESLLPTACLSSLSQLSIPMVLMVLPASRVGRAVRPSLDSETTIAQMHTQREVCSTWAAVAHNSCAHHFSAQPLHHSMKKKLCASLMNLKQVVSMSRRDHQQITKTIFVATNLHGTHIRHTDVDLFPVITLYTLDRGGVRSCLERAQRQNLKLLPCKLHAHRHPFIAIEEFTLGPSLTKLHQLRPQRGTRGILWTDH